MRARSEEMNGEREWRATPTTLYAKEERDL